MRRGIIAALFTTAIGVSACAYFDDVALAATDRYAPYAYDGAAYDHALGPVHFTGAGAALLDPWLSATPEGRRLVSTRFDTRGDRRIDAKAALHANIWFRRHADGNGDRTLTDAEIRAALASITI